MIIDKQTIEKVADLARIEVEDKDIDTLIGDMSKILTFMEKLNELDTTGVEPLVYMNHEENIWREDVVRQEISTEEGLKNAAVHNERFFMVPKIIEK
ncbi:Asp-tRNA(Asn)/Glu-tRNA(Gln) amidotransferase subunit GatC [Pedobacter sp. JY14-1]|uniref:Asp-tRNA(Asn)/Glu-tRNA(Gln) amidotransferase subunit GatC n=1 Tax=Pedobacter sp. JY14-1 TaxID=3034151 RepID=UPI0023E2AC33|nr:Asp-tRNA(Asn)/Glu-tRNA(Gln) amidotransferase subunit GatC [Pedobacter sp. JY14-1]